MDFAPLPLPDAINALIQWMQFNLDPVFGPFKATITTIDQWARDALFALPSYVVIGGAAGFVMWRRRIAAACGVALGLAIIVNLGLWRPAMDTVALVAIASGLSVLAGVPTAILIAESRTAKAAIVPLLDYMQSTPAFVYLIPAVLFFGIGAVPGVLATAAFALPPVTRAVALGLEQVDPRLVEAGRAFGASRFQILRKVKLPLAGTYLQVGLNQCIMMALSMVVICSLIGARGLGIEVITALAQTNLAKGIEAGTCVVLLAMVLDRLCRPKEKREI
jgi:ABC-type proline/glycine betaine transport system permease subunit